MDLAKTIAFGVKQTTDIWDIFILCKESGYNGTLACWHNRNLPIIRF